MGNMISYLKWRGDLSFDERKFCDVDNLVLSQLSYVDFSDIVPEFQSGRSVSVADAAVKVAERKNKINSGIEPPPEFMQEMGNSVRFSDAILSDYININDEENQTEFAALVVTLNDGTVYVSFRGTGDALIGWREDFSMSFELTKSQSAAEKYLKGVIKPNTVYRVGGHSKGGNLAVYSAMMCPKEKQKQIIAVYSNDGPGMCRDIVDIKKYKTIQNKIIRIVPEFSIVGTLFEHEEPDIIVGSSAAGVLQHDALTWNIEGGRFCEKKSYTKECEVYIKIFDKWIESATMEQRKIFTRDFFNALEAGGVKTMSELVNSGTNEFEAILMSIIKSENKTKIVIVKFIKSVIEIVKNVNFKKTIKNKNIIRGIICFVVGIIFIIAPQITAKFVGTGLGATALVILGKLQFDSVFSENFDLKRQKKHFIARMILMSTVSFFIARPEILTKFTDIILGVLFLTISYKYFLKKTVNTSVKRFWRIIYMIFGILILVLGIVSIIYPLLILKSYAFIAGICLIIYSISEMCYTIYKSGKNENNDQKA